MSSWPNLNGQNWADYFSVDLVILSGRHEGCEWLYSYHISIKQWTHVCVGPTERLEECRLFVSCRPIEMAVDQLVHCGQCTHCFSRLSHPCRHTKPVILAYTQTFHFYCTLAYTQTFHFYCTLDYTQTFHFYCTLDYTQTFHFYCTLDYTQTFHFYWCTNFPVLLQPCQLTNLNGQHSNENELNLTLVAGITVTFVHIFSR